MAKSSKQKIISDAVPLSMDSIGDLDGGVFRLLVDKEIDAIAKDLDDRGEEDGKARLLLIQVEIIKVRGMVVLTPQVKAKIPARVCGSTSAKERMKGKGQTELLFQITNPDNAEQPTFEVGDDGEILE